MDYQKHYNRLIDMAKMRNKPDGYTERHHVVPRSMGGLEQKSNLVVLTAREHFLAHYLLAKINGGSQWYAVMIFKAGNHRVVNSRLYEIAKTKHALWMSNKFKGQKLSEAHKSKIAKSLLGNTRTLGTISSNETRNKISKSLFGNTYNLGKTASAETKIKMSEARSGEKHHYFGKVRSEEVKLKLSRALSGRKTKPWSDEVKAKMRSSALAYSARSKQAGINPNP